MVLLDICVEGSKFRTVLWRGGKFELGFEMSGRFLMFGKSVRSFLIFGIERWRWEKEIGK